MSSAESERREVFYSGRVQGVGFRYTTRRIAADYAVTGHVRNLPDGRVELVVEGASGELDRFLAALAAEMSAYISGAESRTSAPRGTYDGFDIRL
ncbi:MAG: acylphosphatase [Pirellulales bacterium]|nr:acylphosphatase [Pirellulales bacterium]